MMVFFVWQSILNDRLGHHSNSIFERLSFVAEPNAYHFAFVAQLMGESGDFGAWTQINKIVLLDFCIFIKKNISIFPLTRGMCVSFEVGIE